MAVTVRIPTALRTYADAQSRAQVNAHTVGEALTALTTQHPALKPHLYDDDGKLRTFVNIYLGDQDVRELNGQNTTLPDGSTLLIVPSVAGGSTSPLARSARSLDGERI